MIFAHAHATPISGVQYVIYVVAAYTITLCALALYGVFLQHRGRVVAPESAATSTNLTGEAPGGFNIGAALLTPVWMWSHGLRMPGAALLAIYAVMLPLAMREMWTPILFVAMVPLAAGAALGFVGNRIAASHRGVESRASFSKSQLPWATVGVLLYAFVVPWVWYFLSAAAGLS